LLTLAYPVSNEPKGLPGAMLLLTIDFEAFIRARTRHLPRHLLYLSDEKGRLLLQPSSERQKALRQASANDPSKLPSAEEEPVLAPFAEHFDRKTAAQQQQLRRERGATVSKIHLENVVYW